MQLKVSANRLSLSLSSLGEKNVLSMNGLWMVLISLTGMTH